MEGKIYLFEHDPEPLASQEFREYLATDFGITDSADQEQAMRIFEDILVQGARENGLIPPIGNKQSPTNI